VPEERNYFSVAFKNRIGQRRASWRTIAGESPAKVLCVWVCV
jgi:hypothetical protein